MISENIIIETLKTAIDMMAKTDKINQRLTKIIIIGTICISLATTIICLYYIKHSYDYESMSSEIIQEVGTSKQQIKNNIESTK